MGRLPWRRSLQVLQSSLARPTNGSAHKGSSSEEVQGGVAGWIIHGRRCLHSSCSDRWPAAGLSPIPSSSGRCRQGYGKETVSGGAFRGNREFHATGQQMARGDFYDILGLSKGATAKEIKVAYYALAKKHHPDVNKEQPEADKKFQEIQQAYEVLKDDEKRALYDQVGHEAYEQAAAGGAPGGSGFHGFSEAFGDIFGGMDEMFKRAYSGERGSGRHAQVKVQLTFRQAVEGCSKLVSFAASVRCDSCKGSGLPPGVQSQNCKDCRGSGRTVIQQGFFTFESTCSSCGGSGQFVKEKCRTCRGAGTSRGMREVNVCIPAGVATGTTMQINGEGGHGAKGQRPGNLLIQLEVEDDPLFRREGADIHVDTSLSFAQAILGGHVQVPTLTGAVMLKVRPGTQPGQQQILRGKGVKMLNSKHYGDQYVHLNVSIPVDISERQRELVEEFVREDNLETENAAEGSG